MGAISFTRNYTDHSNDTGYQFEFQAGARFCAGCGKPVGSSAAKAFCTGCGAQLPGSAKFCSGCGQAAG
jgi:predicted amidophosphoribosyltransferase